MKWADRPFAVSETCFFKYTFSNKASNLQSIKGEKIEHCSSWQECELYSHSQKWGTTVRAPWYSKPHFDNSSVILSLFEEVIQDCLKNLGL